MAKGKLLTPEELRQLLEYNPSTGELVWKERDAEQFTDDGAMQSAARSAWWNARYAGKPALNCIDPSNGYRTGKVKGHYVKAHRVAWAIYHGQWPDDAIDHINGDRADNRISNLRDVTQAENMRNQTRPITNTSGHIGVSFDRQSGKWAAYICPGKSRKKFLGKFSRKEDAIQARAAAESNLGFHPNHGRA